MKTLLTTLIFGLLLSANAMACSCSTPSFILEDRVVPDLKGFMLNKMNVDEREILTIEELEVDNFLTRRDRVINGFFGLFEEEDVLSCSEGCAFYQNFKYQHIIEFKRGDKTCTTILKSKFMGNYLNDGYRSKIKRDDYPVCN